jgi:hypothetical protein
MSHRIDVDFIKDESGVVFAHIKVLDRKLLGHDAKFKLIAKVEVHDKRPVNETKVLFETALAKSLVSEQLVKIPAAKLNIFSYKGKMIDITISTQIVIDDAVFFDTKVSEEQQMKLAEKPKVRTLAEKMIDPEDVFDFFANLKAIPSHNQLITLSLLIAGLAIIGTNMLIGVIDQFSLSGSTIFYDHVDADGEYESPFFKALMGSGAIGVGVWYLIKGQLRKYMQFHFTRLTKIKRGKEYKVSELVNGRSRVPLINVKIRIVACNMEKGQYTRRRGTDDETVSFEEPMRGVMLYEKKISFVPARVPIKTYLNDTFSFDSMFSSLYPPFMISDSHGVDVHWEVQLLHPKYIDHELIGRKNLFDYHDFLEP